MVDSSLKRVFLFFVLLVTVVSVSGQRRSVRDVLQTAAQFDERMSTHRAVPSTADVLLFPRIVGGDEDGAYYFVESARGNATLIVSGDERMIPVLGYFERGVEEQIPDNMRALLEQYVVEYRSLALAESVTLHKRNVVGLGGVGVEPLIPTVWGQDEPFNSFCPMWKGQRCVTGCLATAMAQIMYTNRYPECGRGVVDYTTETHGFPLAEDLSLHPFDYGAMVADYSLGTTQEQRDAVANLCYMAGLALGADYDPSGTSATDRNFLNALVNNFGYDPDMTFHRFDYTSSMRRWEELIQTELLCGRPVYYAGTTMAGAGHGFIVDGFTPDDDATYYHVNWGWAGHGNGYFVLTGLVGAGQYFSRNHMILTGIAPDDSIQTVRSCMGGTVSVSSGNMKVTELGVVTATLNIQNLSYRSFTGDVTIKVQSPDGSESSVASYRLNNLQLNGVTMLSAKFIPQQLLGNYEVKAYSKALGETEEQEISLGGELCVRVISAEDDLPYKATNIQATAMMVDKNSAGDNKLDVALNGITNFSSTSFVGTAAVALSDTLGNIIMVLDGGTLITSPLAHYQAISTPRRFTATVPDTIADGHYHLHAMTCQSGYSGWSLMHRYSVNQGVISEYDKPLYEEIWMQRGEVFMMDPTNIGQSMDLVVNIDGEGVVTIDDTINVSQRQQTLKVDFGVSPTLRFEPNGGKQLASFKVNGISYLHEVDDLTYTFMTPISRHTTIDVVYDDAIDFTKELLLEYDETESSVSMTADGMYAKGSKLKFKIQNKSGLEVIEKGIYLSDGRDGVKSNNLLSAPSSLPNNITRTWTLTLGNNYFEPVFHECIQARGQEFVLTCSILGTDGIASSTISKERKIIGIYSIDGKRVLNSYRGPLIIKYSDGTIQKVIDHK